MKRRRLSRAGSYKTVAEGEADQQSGAQAATTDENAQQWFEQTNENVTGGGLPRLGEDEPPFYLVEGSSTFSTHPEINSVDISPSTDDQYQRHSWRNAPASKESSSEEYRSVIDDLTIENQKLRQRLRRFENLHCWHLQKEKLFEVRTHLPAHKKRELEKALFYVAETFGAAPPRPLAETSIPRPESSIHAVATSKPSSLSTSVSRPVDSAYASMLPSGYTSGSQSQPFDRSTAAGQIHEAKQKVNRFLDDSATSLQESPVLTERAKKKAVVRRLEELFSGTRGGTGRNRPPLRQHSFLRSTADRKLFEPKTPVSGPEGTREALIIPTHAHSLEGKSEAKSEASGLHNASSIEVPADGTSTEDAPSEQRPTRLSDVHADRTQNPKENMEYIRHLGLDVSAVDGNAASDNPEGWMFLNLLMNMAQLHTLNITVDFVRAALSEFSEKFELSADGRDIRWRGSLEHTRVSSDAESLVPAETESPWEEGATPSAGTGRAPSQEQDSERAREHRGQTSETKSDRSPGRPVAKSHQQLHYAPVLFHRGHAYGETKHQARQTGSASSSGSWHECSSNLSIPSSVGNGPMIFYNQAAFCTDLSGDAGTSLFHGSTHSQVSSPRYVLGMPDTPSTSAPPGVERKGPLSLPFSEAPVDAGCSEDELNRLLSVAAWAMDLTSDSTQAPVEPLLLEASGIGGVWPLDNFVIQVVRSHPNAAAWDTHASADGISSRLSRLAGQPIHTARPRHQLHSRIIHLAQIDLPTSMLPPPFFAHGSASSDASGSSSDSASHSCTSGDASPAAVAGASLARPPASLDSDESSTIDMLGHARRLDPDTVAAREREFESNVADAFAHEIPPGRSASNSGGGGGWNASAASSQSQSQCQEGGDGWLSSSSSSSSAGQESRSRGG